MADNAPSDNATKGSAHVDLNDPYFQNALWSNDSADLEIQAYFDPQKPNLGDDFGIVGLKPVIKRLDNEQFLLKDDSGNFYVWQPDEGNLWRITETDLMLNAAVDLVMNGVNESQLVKMFGPTWA